MCLITPFKEPKVAEEDMTVYKILTDNQHSSFYSPFYYNLGELYETKMEESEEWLYADETAQKSTRRPYNDLICIGKGFHSCNTIERAEELKEGLIQKRHVFECTIPKGSMYYEDTSGLLVSNQIIVNKKYVL